MRKILAIMEGEKLPDGRLADVGAFYVEDKDQDRIPVSWANDAMAPTPIGWAHGFERIEHDTHADLSVDIVMNDENLQESLDHFELYIFATDLVEVPWREGCTSEQMAVHHKDPPTRIVKRARIRMLQLVPIQGVPFGMAKTRTSSHEL